MRYFFIILIASLQAIATISAMDGFCMHSEQASNDIEEAISRYEAIMSRSQARTTPDSNDIIFPHYYNDSEFYIRRKYSLVPVVDVHMCKRHTIEALLKSAVAGHLILEVPLKQCTDIAVIQTLRVEAYEECIRLKRPYTHTPLKQLIDNAIDILRAELIE